MNSDSMVLTTKSKNSNAKEFKMWCLSILVTYLSSQGLLFHIATVHFDWIFIFVGTDDGFALFKDFLNFGTVTIFRQFFYDNLFLQIASVIDEAQFVEETFSEFLQNEKNKIISNSN